MTELKSYDRKSCKLQGIYKEFPWNQQSALQRDGRPARRRRRASTRVRLPALHMELAQCWVIGLLCVNMSVGGGGRGEGVEQGKGENGNE